MIQFEVNLAQVMFGSFGIRLGGGGSIGQKLICQNSICRRSIEKMQSVER